MNSIDDAVDSMRALLQARDIRWEEKRMMGGLCFMVDGKMCFGTYKGGLMVRIDPGEAPDLAARPGVEQLVMGGREMKGYLLVSTGALSRQGDLAAWIERCLAFNPKAKASKKRRQAT